MAGLSHGARRALGAGLVVLGVIALVAYLAGAFDSSRHRHATAVFSVPASGGALSGRSLTSAAAGARDSPNGRSGAGARRGGSEVIKALDNYWEDIEQHAYGAAFGFYSPGALDITEAQFISEQERAATKSVAFDGTVTASTKALDEPNRSYATVAVNSLVTHDAQHGCRRWSGTYTMLLEESGLWHIQQAALSAHPC